MGAVCKVLLPPANCRRRIMDKARPDWLRSANGGVGNELDAETGARAASGVGKAADTAAWVGTAALRWPVRTRSVGGGSADLPWDSARRLSRAALRPLDDMDGNADMVVICCNTRPANERRRDTR
jgi:hypothetical protein